MAQTQYIKIKKEDLREALLAAFEAGWSGTLEVSESIVTTIIAGLGEAVVPATDDSILIQKLSAMMSKKGWKDNAWNDMVHGGFPEYTMDEAKVGTLTKEQLYYKNYLPEYSQKKMHQDWDAAQ